MNHYIDIEIKPDSKMRENVLLNKVYTKFHKALVTLTSNAIGISFPQYKIKLGKVLRIHSDISMLRDLSSANWLEGLTGYCQISDIREIPANTQYRIVSRKQSNMTQSKLNRLIKRNSISTDEIKSYKAKMFSQGLDNPYMELESSSTGHRHRRYIEFSPVLKDPVEGKFDTFGLSKTATVPWF